MPITPDTKDWTWVVDRPCEECGFHAEAYPNDAVARSIRENARTWVEVLTRVDVRARPDDDHWSPLEYACHVRDVYRIFDVRLRSMLQDDGPAFENWDQDATAREERYELQSPSLVGSELLDASNAYANRFEGVGSDQWSRTGTRSNGSHFSVASLGTYSLHDVIHHLWDVSAR